MVFNSKEAALETSASLVPVLFGSGVLHPPKYRHTENTIRASSEYFIVVDYIADGQPDSQRCSISLLLAHVALHATLRPKVQNDFITFHHNFWAP